MNKKEKPEKKLNNATEKPLHEIRNLILGDEISKIAQIEEKLNNPKVRAQELSDILPEVINLRENKDDKLSRALMPTIEKSIRTSITRDSKFLANTLYPIMGPSIRKAISETFRQMIQSLNQSLEKSFSWQGLKWRIEALRSGKSFAEVVLIHTLIYKVEQVFLIHRKTGLVIKHIVEQNSQFQDPDMVSGMLSAIQDFIHDSFSLNEGDELQTMQMGELTVVIEQGPLAVLAAVIRGHAPEDVKLFLRETLENIHFEKEQDLETYDGDNDSFESIDHHLQSCLIQKKLPPKTKKISKIWIVSIPVFVVVCLLIISHFIEGYQWKSYIRELESEPGIVITSTKKEDGKFILNGMRDPLSKNPQIILGQTKLNPDNIISDWRFYQDLNPDFIENRSYAILRPPPEVTLRFQHETLFIRGTASHHWISDAKLLARTLPGVRNFDTTELIDSEMERFQSLKDALENQVFLFPLGSSDFLSNQEDNLEILTITISELYTIAKPLDIDFIIRVVGHTDMLGTESRNLELSLDRAERMIDYLISQGIGQDYLQITGMASSIPVTEDISPEQQRLNRRVTIEIIQQ